MLKIRIKMRKRLIKISLINRSWLSKVQKKMSERRRKQELISKILKKIKKKKD